MSVGIALSLPWTIGVPVFIGYLIDEKFGYKPAFLITGLFIGLVSGVLEVYVLVKRMKLMK